MALGHGATAGDCAEAEELVGVVVLANLPALFFHRDHEGLGLHFSEEILVHGAHTYFRPFQGEGGLIPDANFLRLGQRRLEYI